MRLITLITLFLLTYNSAHAYYHKFIAENSGTRISRRILNAIFFHNPNPNIIDRASNNYFIPRDNSHVLFVGTPKSTQEQVPISNQRTIEAKEKMVAKKKTQKKIDKELKEQPFAYSTLTIPDWEKTENVSMFLTALSHRGLYKGKKTSSKVLIDFNVVDANNNVVCNSTEPLKTIKLTDNGMKYIHKIYFFNGFLGDDTIYIKNYDPKCLVSYRAKTIAVEYKTKKGKPIHNTIEMEFFKNAIRKDFNL